MYQKRSWSTASGERRLPGQAQVSLYPAHDPPAKVPGELGGGGVVEADFLPFRLHLEGSTAAIIFPINDELVTIPRALRQHGLVHALNRNAELGVVQLALQHDEEMRRLGVERQKLQQSWLPGYEARQRPVRAHPGSERLVGIVTRQRVEQVRLIVEKAVLQVDRERQRMQHQAARRGKIVDRLEGVALIKNMLARAMIGGEAVFAATIGRHGIEIEIERQRSEIAVDVHTIVFEAEMLMQMTRGS
jgi:hypothetical protein